MTLQWRPWRPGGFSRYSPWSLLALLATACLGCDGEWTFAIPPWDAGAPGTGDMGACAAWAESRCTYADRCPAAIRGRVTHAQCVERSVLTCELLAGDPNVAFDPQVVAACAYPTDCSPPTLAVSWMCLPRGKAPVGASCVFAESCQTGTCAYSFDTATQRLSTCGVCYATCDPPCDDGGLCVNQEDGGQGCMAVPTIGQPCSLPIAACQNAYCRGLNGNAPGVCVAWARLGEACGDGESAPLCGDVDTYCDFATHVCRAVLPAAYGQPCLSTPDAEYTCAAYASCDTEVSGSCIPPAPDGALCDLNQGLQCLPPATCIANHCLFPSLGNCGLSR